MNRELNLALAGLFTLLAWSPLAAQDAVPERLKLTVNDGGSERW